MTRTKLSLTVLMLAAMVAGGSRAQAQGRATAEWLFWHRNADSDQTLIGPSAVSADDSGFGYDAGFRFSLGYGLGDYDIEAVFSQVPNWQATDGTVLTLPLVFNEDPMAFLSPSNTLGFRNGLTDAANSDVLNVFSLDPGATVQTNYESTLDDFQLNLGTNREIRPVWAAIGWRHVELDENSSLLVTGDFQSTDAMAGTPGTPLPAMALTDAGFTVIQGDGSFNGYDPMAMNPVITTIGGLFQGVADNDLDGGQIVLGGRFQPRDLVSIEVFMTAGLYHNRAEGSVVETIFGIENDDDILQRRFSDADTVASFVGGLGFRLIVPVTDYIFFRAGYEGMLVSNVALGPDQSQGLGTTILGERFYKVQTGGNLVAHGGHLGLGLTW